jgi:hypothetical protein
MVALGDAQRRTIARGADGTRSRRGRAFVLVAGAREAARFGRWLPLGALALAMAQPVAPY